MQYRIGSLPPTSSFVDHQVTIRFGVVVANKRFSLNSMTLPARVMQTSHGRRHFIEYSDCGSLPEHSPIAVGGPRGQGLHLVWVERVTPFEQSLWSDQSIMGASGDLPCLRRDIDPGAGRIFES